ncbi:unnamed protein product [Calypogeia fissa]
MDTVRSDVEAANLGVPPGKMWAIDQRLDQPLGPESTRVRTMSNEKKAMPTRMLLFLAFQSLGVVYGDLGTSPLYVFRSTFPDGFSSREAHADEILGALSLIIYTISLIPLLKYMFIVLNADDNGEGGTFALYSLICRYCNFSSLPSRHPTDAEIQTYRVRAAEPNSHSDSVRRLMEKSKLLQNLLLILVLLSTCMVIGDGILTPAISVLSAVDGIKKASSHLNQSVVVIISLVILVLLFNMQRFGTGYIGVLFAPIVMTWFMTNAAIGIYNIAQHDSSIFRAFSPYYAIRYLVKNKERGWSSLGGIVLCITGTEALYADLGHFSARSIQLAFTVLVFPALILAYLGQAAYLMDFPENVTSAFYSSLPKPLYWPVFVLATVAASIASQAIISATFSIVKQAAALSCFPRVKVIHTSYKLRGQVYIPEINWIVMICCLVITAGFRDTPQIGNAYGIAVVGVMFSTTIIMFLVIIVVWRRNIWLALAFLVVFGSVEAVYYSAVLYKVQQGGWVPLAIAGTVLTVMYVWHYGTIKRYEFEIQNKVSVGWVLGLAQGLGLVRVPGVGLVYTDLAHGVPPILSHFITNLPAIHSILVFVCIKYLPVNTVPQYERFHMKRIGPKSFSMFRCAARYGYMDLHKKDDDFEQELIAKLTQYMKYEEVEQSHGEDDNVPGDWTSISTTVSTTPPKSGDTRPQQQSNATSSSSVAQPVTSSSTSSTLQALTSSNSSSGQQQLWNTLNTSNGIGSPELQSASSSVNSAEEFATRPHHRARIGRPPNLAVALPEESVGEIGEESLNELDMLRKNMDTGVVYLLGNIQVKARKSSGFLKKVVIDWIYAFLRKTCRESLVIYSVPHESLLQVGMVYYV